MNYKLFINKLDSELKKKRILIEVTLNNFPGTFTLGYGYYYSKALGGVFGIMEELDNSNEAYYYNAEEIIAGQSIAEPRTWICNTNSIFSIAEFCDRLDKYYSDKVLDSI